MAANKKEIEKKVTETIENCFAAIRKLDAKAFAANFAEDAEVNDPVGSPTIKGRAAIGEHFKQITAAFSQLDLRAEEYFPCGNQAAAFFLGTGTGKDGTTVALEGIDVFEMNAEGKITNLKGFWNPEPATEKLSKR